MTTVCGLPPAEFRARKPFAELTVVNPDRRFHLGDGGNVTMRLVDLLARERERVERSLAGPADRRPDPAAPGRTPSRILGWRRRGRGVSSCAVRALLIPSREAEKGCA